MKENPPRIHEIDILRGLAVTAMIYYHLIYDLVFFYGKPFDLNHLSLRLAALAAPAFFVLAGISTHFSKNILRRALRIGGAALMVTIFTYLQNPDYFVLFGTLHFLSVTMFLSYFFIHLSNGILLLMAFISWGAGAFFSSVSTNITWLFPIGITYPGFRSSDYYPIFPYVAYTLIGIFLGRWLYVSKKSLFPQLHFPLLQWIGRNSLLLYLLHQPILLALLWIIHRYTSLI